MSALLALFFAPFILSVVAICMPATNRRLAFVLALVPLCILIMTGSSLLGQEVNYSWFSALSIRFHLAVDNLSLVFLYLTCAIIPVSILAPYAAKIERPNFYYGFILLLEALLIGFFTSKDLVCFTFFFEAILLPLYFLISSWGSGDKEKAAFTFIIYMIAGSALMVASVLALYFAAGTFDIGALRVVANSLPHASIIAAIFLLAFAVKTPLFPFHSWLPETYCKAPVAGTILLSAILSKAGVYGILRISIGLFPSIMMAWSPFLLSLAIIGVLYGAFAAWGQNDFKRLIAYSSFSHVNFILAGLFVYNSFAQGGAILQAVNHAVTITGLFLVAGWLELRLQTTHFGQISGLASYLPRLAWLTFFFVLSAVALPGLNNFVSEVMVLYGVFIHSWYMSLLLGLTVVFSVLYMLKFLHSVYFGTPSMYKAEWVDIRVKELLIALPLAILCVWLGLYPAPLLDQVEPAAAKILEK